LRTAYVLSKLSF